MQTALTALGVISVIEALLWLQPLWRWRKVVAGILMAPLATASGLVLGAHPAVWTAVLLCLSMYRAVNLLRVIEDRPHADFLYNTARRTSWLLLGAQIVIVGLVALPFMPTNSSFWLHSLLVTQYACVLILLASTIRHARTTRPPVLTTTYAARDLPTLSVAIPARNETDDLKACLQSLTASDYPKLEILVLDDCSQEKRTPEIIRGFAHDGVRFISGEVPPKRWLAKNYAYKQLAEASNGELLLFCGVDVRFQPSTLRILVTSMLQKKKYMVSVAPHNAFPPGRSVDTLLTQPLRYAWELALPRRLLHRPPVLSTCWMIYRDLLNDSGGFDSVSHSISPESYFARRAAAHDDGYSFLHSDETLGLICRKDIAEQRATAVRTRYPQLHRRPELVAGLSLLELAWLIGPFGIVVTCLVTGSWGLAGWSGLNCLLLWIFYARIVEFTYHKRAFLGGVLLPVAALYDIALLNISMWQYEFSEVIWKSRNVCIPVMRVIAGLPKE